MSNFLVVTTYWFIFVYMKVALYKTRTSWELVSQLKEFYEMLNKTYNEYTIVSVGYSSHFDNNAKMEEYSCLITYQTK